MALKCYGTGVPIKKSEPKIIAFQGIDHLNRCYQCYACSDACPIAFAMDYLPNQLIHLTRLGFKERVLKSKTI